MKVKKFWGIVLAFTMAISNVNIVMAKEQGNLAVLTMAEEDIFKGEMCTQEKEGLTEVRVFELVNGAEIRIKENGEIRIAEYFINDVKKQIAVLNRNSGDIYYYDLSQQNASLSSYSEDDSTLSDTYTLKYNIRDFLQSQTNNGISSQATNNASSYSDDDDRFYLIKRKSFASSGITLERELYGFTDSKYYKQNSWHFSAGTALSVISLVCGYLPGVGTALSTLATVAGTIITDFGVQEWIKEFFWVYKFKQIKPTTIELVCTQQFTYEKQRKVEINGDVGYWETIEKMENWEIDLQRDDILTNPGYYV